MTRTYFFSAKKYAKNSSLKIFDKKEVPPPAIVKNFVGDKLRECMGYSSRPSGREDKRINIINIASKELGVREATGKNDGLRVEEYLAYTGLGKHHEWCAAFVSWCYGQAGMDVPRNPWSPALFPKARLMDKAMAQAADVFGIYGVSAKRINHVGLVKEKRGEYLVSLEGNSNDRVESRRRHLRTVHAIANWVE